MVLLKQISLGLLILAGSYQARSQEGMRFSFNLDPQFAWLRSSDDSISPDGSIIHIRAMLEMDYFFASNYAFYLGFGVNNLGGKLLYQREQDYLSDDDTVTIVAGQKVKMNLQYLDIPLGLKLKTEELGYNTIFLQLGFNPMINLNARVSSDTESANGPLDRKGIKNSMNLFHLGYHLGAGVEHRLGGNTAIIGGVRWTSGITNISKKDGADLILNSLSINIGILF